MSLIKIKGEEIKKVIAPFYETYGWTLMARTGHDIQHPETYHYEYVDDLGICIDINPVTSGFRFSKVVEFMFQLGTPNEFTPLDYENHFSKNYLKFRKIVIDHNLYNAN